MLLWFASISGGFGISCVVGWVLELKRLRGFKTYPAQDISDLV